MKKLKTGVLFLFIAAITLSTCDNFFHDLIPPNGDRILSFTVPGQEGETVINENTVFVNIGKDVDVHSLIPEITVSPKARYIPLTMDYVQAAFPQVDVVKEAMNLYQTEDIAAYVENLIKQTPDFTVPEPGIPIDFAGPVNILVISAQGTIREYKVYVGEDTGEPRLLGIRFSKYDNPEIIGDALCQINEKNRTVMAGAMYPMEIDDLTYALIPSFDILGDRVEIDGMTVESGKTAVQFTGIMLVPQTKTITVFREGKSVHYILSMYFTEDPDSIRSIIDFRFLQMNNPLIAATAVGSIINTDNTGTITVQVFCSSAKPSMLTPTFITPGTVTVNGVTQISGMTSHGFDTPLEYLVVSRNGQYRRVYTVQVEVISLTQDTPRITSFGFLNTLNLDLVQNATGEIGDAAGMILVDVYYGSNTAPYTLTPTFSAEGIVTVSNSVQISGASAQDFRYSIMYKVTHPTIPQLTRDYWVQVRFTRDTSSDASITAFSFHPDDNPGLEDEIVAKINQVTGTISIYAPAGFGITSREMVPRFTAVGQVRVGGINQTSGVTGQMFDAPITYTAVSANGKNSKTYIVDVRELQSTLYVNCNATGINDGTSWEDAFTSLQSACQAALEFPDYIPKEIWIAKGTYKPGVKAEDYFLLVPNTSYIGGFAGNETAKSQRNTAENPVIISGDLGSIRSQNLFGSFSGNIAQTVNGDIAFENLAFTGARAQGIGGRAHGSAICLKINSGSELRIIGCTFNDLQSSSEGGAIYFYDGNAYISNTYFSTCSSAVALGGGAVYLTAGSGTAEFSNVTIGGISGGGAIFNDSLSKSLKITNSVITWVTGNYAVCSYGVLEVDGLELSNITGSGIYSYGSASSLTNLNATTINGTYGIFSVGGIKIINSRIIGTGNGIYSNGSLEVNGLLSYGFNGTGFTVTNGPLIFSDVEAHNITEKSVSFSGSAHRVEIRNSGFYTCGEVNILSSSSVLLDDVDIKGLNSGAISALSIYSYGNVTINSVRIDNVPNGRGIYTNNSGTTVIRDTAVLNCSSPKFGGGIYLNGGSAQILGTIIENVTASYGGGIYADTYSLTIISSIIRYTFATNNFGGLFSSGSLSINNCEFYNCNARNDYKIMNQTVSSTIQNSRFIHENLFNHGPPNTDSELTFFSCKGTFVNCTFTNLRSNKGGRNYIFSPWAEYRDSSFEGIKISGSDLILRNCTFNLNSGSAGILAFYNGNYQDGSPAHDYLFMEGVIIRDNGGQRPLIWFTSGGGRRSNVLRFSNSNVNIYYEPRGTMHYIIWRDGRDPNYYSFQGNNIIMGFDLIDFVP